MIKSTLKPDNSKLTMSYHIYDTFMLNTVPYEKYHTVWGPLESYYVTYNYMYVKYELNYDLTRSILVRWAFPLLQAITKYY